MRNRSLRPTLNVLLLTCLVASLVALGCGDDPKPKPGDPVVIVPDTNVVDTDVVVQPDGHIGTDVDIDFDALNDIGADVIEEISLCPEGENLGLLKPGDTRKISASFPALRTADPDSITGCFEGARATGRKLYSFRVSKPSIIDLSVNTGPTTTTYMELNRGDCTADDALECTLSNNRRIIVEPNRIYTVLIDARTVAPGLPQYELVYKIEELACYPGVPVCRDGHMQECIRGTSVEAFACAGSVCGTPTSCAGDICSQAIDVELSAASQVSFDGHRRGYNNVWDAEDRTGCSFYEDPVGPPTPGGETFFRLKGLPAGKTLTIDATSLGGAYGFLILADCASEQCLDGGSYNDNFDVLMDWTVPATADYIVVFEALGDSSRPWEVIFSLN
ncbi:MAG: hypothetical protein H0U74_10335 [Bradymonadaceae bacterium]|nr:hypothetical protein [Lujinxingiaceae bacterium]